MAWNWQFWLWTADQWFYWLGGLLTALAALFAFGCVQQQPIEQFAGKFVDGVIEPAVKEGLSRGVESLTIQAGAQGINPTYRVDFEGFWCTGIKGMASVGVQGLSGQMAITSLSPVRTELPGGVVRMPTVAPPPTPEGGAVAPPDDTVLHLPPPGEGGRPAATPISLSEPAPIMPKTVPAPARLETKRVKDFRVINRTRLVRV